MSAPFTPAPWRLRIEPYEDDPFPGKDFFVVRLGDDAIQGITEPANARLIAAAPELYEALDAIERHCRNERGLKGADHADEGQRLRAQSQAALAKARGEQ